jgi:hypothetical protein
MSSHLAGDILEVGTVCPHVGMIRYDTFIYDCDTNVIILQMCVKKYDLEDYTMREWMEGQSTERSVVDNVCPEMNELGV